MKAPGAFRLAVATGALLSAGFASRASAAAYQIEARTEAQLYQIRAYRGTDPSAPVLLPRRRLAQYLGLNVFELVTGQPLGFESSLRVFADLGLPQGEAERIDGLRSEDADVLYANISYRGPHTEVRLGRQLYVDLMDYMAFDGLKVRYVHPSGLGAEAYAGLWVKASSILGSSVYQPDGIRDSNPRRVGLLSTAATTVLDDLEPVYGGKLILENLAGISTTLGYRTSLLGGKTDLQRLALESRYGKGRGLNLLAGAEYDLVLPRISQLRAQARYDRDLYAVTLEAMRFSPVLSADSIFLYFATAPRDEVRARVDYTPVGPLRYYAQGLFDLYGSNLSSRLDPRALTALGAPASTAAGGSLGAALHAGSFHSAGDLTYKVGFGGEQLWLDLTAGYAPESTLWTIDGRVSVARITDQLNPLLRGNFLGGQLWARYLLSRASRLSVVLEENLNAYTRSDTKLFFLFDLKAAL